MNLGNIVKWFYMEVRSFTIFYPGFLLGIPVYPSNLASSGTAVTFIFNLIKIQFIVLISYYAVSINLFSFLKHFVARVLLHPLVAVTLPVSFFVNYFFSKIIQTKICSSNLIIAWGEEDLSMIRHQILIDKLVFRIQ